MSQTILLALCAFSTIFIAGAAYFLLRVSDRDLRVIERTSAAQGSWSASAGNPSSAVPDKRLSRAVQGAVSNLGRTIMASGILPGKTRDELEQTLLGSGFRGSNALAMFIGSKLILLGLTPLGGWFLADWQHLVGMPRIAVILGFAVVGLVAPDYVMRQIRKGYLGRVEAGLPDALDLLTICAQAGLSLEPGMTRVSNELRLSRPEVAREFEMTVRELEVLSDSSMALGNLGRRTGLESLKRLTSTLIQTMQYGTPLTDGLRTLSNEMRQMALTSFEERAARLPVMLTLPMILFILPCVFIVVGGPAGIQVARSLGK
jgi:tight adherence protein C